MEKDEELCHKKIMNFLNGKRWIVNKNQCRGCFLQKHQKDLSPYLDPIFEDKDICIRQDAEWSIPAFYIISTKKHISSLIDMPINLALKLAGATYFTRKAMKNVLKIDKAQIYHEERLINSHYHQWILPLWPHAMKHYNIYPKIYDSNVKKYINLFKFKNNYKNILKLNKKIRDYFLNNREVIKFFKTPI